MTLKAKISLQRSHVPSLIIKRIKSEVYLPVANFATLLNKETETERGGVGASQAECALGLSRGFSRIH